MATITTYWLDWSAAVRLRSLLDEDSDMFLEVEEQMTDAYECGYPNFEPDAVDIVFDSRFEQDIMDFIDAHDIPRRVVETETPE